MLLAVKKSFTPNRKVIDQVFTVYTRQQCCCCHRALEVLKSFQKRYNFSIETVDVDADPKLVGAYGESVPVVLLNGKVRFRGVVKPILLSRLLEATRQ